ncbi:hypothetical protein FQR65_LT20842 [Abscondita terminalis]|nr:hypothetical protein FQR65_LT20842 [Abscondita terminalis]
MAAADKCAEQTGREWRGPAQGDRTHRSDVGRSLRRLRNCRGRPRCVLAQSATQVYDQGPVQGEVRVGCRSLRYAVQRPSGQRVYAGLTLEAVRGLKRRRLDHGGDRGRGDPAMTSWAARWSQSVAIYALRFLRPRQGPPVFHQQQVGAHGIQRFRPGHPPFQGIGQSGFAQGLGDHDAALRPGSAHGGPGSTAAWGYVTSRPTTGWATKTRCATIATATMSGMGQGYGLAYWPICETTAWSPFAYDCAGGRKLAEDTRQRGVQQASQCSSQRVDAEDNLRL